MPQHQTPETRDHLNDCPEGSRIHHGSGSRETHKGSGVDFRRSRRHHLSLAERQGSAGSRAGAIMFFVSVELWGLGTPNPNPCSDFEDRNAGRCAGTGVSGSTDLIRGAASGSRRDVLVERPMDRRLGSSRNILVDTAISSGGLGLVEQGIGRGDRGPLGGLS